MEKFPASYTESMNSVLIQEMERFNKLLAAMCSDLEALMKAIKGFAVMSPALEAISSSLIVGKVPESWTKVSYPSLKPLASYVADFLERIKFLEVRNHMSISVTISHSVNIVFIITLINMFTPISEFGCLLVLCPDCKSKMPMRETKIKMGTAG
jgi:hypothetical protein